MVIIVNNTTVYWKWTKRANLKCTHHKRKKNVFEVIDVLTNFIVAIILQYVCLSNCHIF